jgi:hypothetical protein
MKHSSSVLSGIYTPSLYFLPLSGSSFYLDSCWNVKNWNRKFYNSSPCSDVIETDEKTKAEVTQVPNEPNEGIIETK